MSFALPSVKPKPCIPDSFGTKEGAFGVLDLMTSGLSSARCNLEPVHPLTYSELNYGKNVDKINLAVLRNTQGLHAPLKISMEKKYAKKIGRLACLPSSNIMHDVLTGKDLEIGPEDILNTAEFIEVAGQPHAVIEHSLGLL